MPRSVRIPCVWIGSTGRVEAYCVILCALPARMHMQGTDCICANVCRRARGRPMGGEMSWIESGRGCRANWDIAGGVVSFTRPASIIHGAALGTRDCIRFTMKSDVVEARTLALFHRIREHRVQVGSRCAFVRRFCRRCSRWRIRRCGSRRIRRRSHGRRQHFKEKEQRCTHCRRPRTLFSLPTFPSGRQFEKPSGQSEQ